MSIDGQLELERYNESMFERESNGLPTMSFVAWRKDQARLDELFEDLKRKRDLAHQERATETSDTKEAEDDIEAEEQMESEFFNRKS